jgi:hypothetical protein
MGINDGLVYTTLTWDASAPSVPVTCDAVTTTGEALQVLTEVPTFGNACNSANAYVQAVVESPAVLVLWDVYIAATRAALCVAMSE